MIHVRLAYQYFYACIIHACIIHRS